MAGNWRGWLLAIAGAVVTVVVVVWLQPGASGTQSKHPLVWALLAGWVIVPPMWFLAEWAYWAPQRGGQALEEYKQAVEDFKYTQQLSREVWLAVAVALAAFYGIKILG